MWSYLQKKALHTALPRCLEIRFLSCNFGSTKPLPSYAPLWKQQTFDFWSVDTVSVVWPRFEFWIILWTSVGFRWVRSLSHRASEYVWVLLTFLTHLLELSWSEINFLRVNLRQSSSGRGNGAVDGALDERNLGAKSCVWNCLNIKWTSNEHQIKINQNKSNNLSDLVPFMCLVPMQWKEALHYFPRKKWCVPLCWQCLPVQHGFWMC